MTKQQYKVTGSDESYTLPSLVKGILPFIEEFKKTHKKDNITIWCPFDVDTKLKYGNITLQPSQYVKILKEAGYNVIHSHIATGQDFFEYEPKEYYDLIVSNSPFGNKAKFFTRALELNKPFALVTTASWLNDGGLFNVFYKNNKQLQLLMSDKRSKFFNENGLIDKGISFKAIYVCWNFLQGRDIDWFELDRKIDKEFLNETFNSRK